MPGSSSRVLGRLLVEAGVVSERAVADALVEQRRTRERIGEVLVRRGLEAEHVARALAVQLRLPYAVAPLTPEPEALGLVDRVLACRARIMPLAATDRALRIAMADPLDAAALADLRFQTGRRIEASVAVPRAVEDALALAYGAALVPPAGARAADRPAGTGRSGMAGEAVGSGAVEADEVNALREASTAPPIVALVEEIVSRAAALKASDIHIEPGSGRLRVRVRVDGLLRELMALPAQAGAAVASRIKIMAGLDIAVKRRPQDGRGAFRTATGELGLRVSTLPTETGEKVVLRLLEGENALQHLEDLGLGPAPRRRLERLLQRGHGVVLVTGPTGSGKTTTLYTALSGMDRERRNVITLEDPIEYRLPGINQVQVHRKAGLTFAAALRAVLRQDPDIIMVGEMRDRETVEVGLAAALTGHLVLSTLHTNDAPGAVTRLAEMRAPRYLIAGGLIGVLAQRLTRRLCRHCRERAVAEADALRELGLPARPTPVWMAAGCERCDRTGYHGRTGIFELLVVDGRIRDAILRRAPVDVVREMARAAGMVPLALDAWQKVLDGHTSLEEVAPLLSLIGDEVPVCPACGASIRSGFRSCPACGHRLRRRCACGADLELEWRFCAACGEEGIPGAEGGSRDGESATS